MSSSLANIFDTSSESENEQQPTVQSPRQEEEVSREEEKVVNKESEATDIDSHQQVYNQKSGEETEEYKSPSVSEEEPASNSPEEESEKELKSDAEEDRPLRHKPGKKKGKKQKEGGDEEEQQPPESSEKALEARRDFEEALARVSSSGSRRRRHASGGGEGTAYSDSVEFDDFALSLRNKMDLALRRDIQSMNNGKAALERHKLLPQVIAALNRRGLQDIMLENGILSSIRSWLEPVKTNTSCSLPGINLRKPLLETLKSLPIDTSSLRESGIGRIVYFFSKRDDEASEIKRLSSELVIKWSQPIIGSFDATMTDDTSLQTTDYDADSNERHLESEKYRRLRQSGDSQYLSPSYLILPNLCIKNSHPRASAGS